MRLQDKIVLITGASRGVGAACALACAEEGAHLALVAKTLDSHATLPGSLNEVADQVRALGREAVVLQADLRDEDQAEAAVAGAVSHFGRLDALVNNAGAIFMSSIADWPTKRFDLVMGVNVRAAFLMSRACIPHLRERGGHILMMSPPIHPKAAPGKAPYLTSKIGMTLLGMAIDVEEKNIAAHALWPVTGIRTAATEVFGMGTPEQWREPAILADATVALLSKDPAESSFQAWLDEEVLAEEGIHDLTHYRCVADSEPEPFSISWIDPDWSR